MKKIVIFDGIVGYNNALSLLYNIDEPEKQVSLYGPTNKCLHLLVENQQEVVSQYVFLNRYGKTKVR